MKRLAKWLLYVILLVLLLLAVVIGIVLFLGGSDRGFAWLGHTIDERIDALELDTLGGNLINGVDAGSVRFANEGMTLAVDGVDSTWRMSCLLKREFCIDRIVIESVDIETRAVEASEEAAPAGEFSLPDIALPIDVTVDEILLKRVRFKPPGEAPEQIIENIRLGARTEGSVVKLDTIALDYQNYAAELDGQLQLQGEWPLELTLNLAATDVVETHDINVALRLSNTVEVLDIAADISGAVSAQLDGQVQPLEKTLPARLSIRSSALGWPLDTLAQVKANDVAVDLEGTLADYDLTVSTALEGEQLPATDIVLSGQVNSERLELPGIDIDTLGGGIDGKATVNWQDGLDWQADLTLDNIDPGQQLAELNGLLDGRVRTEGSIDDEGVLLLSVDELSIDGQLQDIPLQLDARLGKGKDEVWRIDTVSLVNGENRVNAAGSVGELWDLEADVRLPQLQNFLPELAGGFRADLSIDGPLATPSLKLDANSQVITFNDILVEGISLDADVSEAANRNSALNLAIGKIQVGTQTISNMRLAIDGTREAHELTLFADGPQATAVDIALSGALDESFNWVGSLDTAMLELPAHELLLESPMDMAWQQSAAAFRVGAHCWTSEETRLCLEDDVMAAADGDAKVSLKNYPLSRLNPFLPAETTLRGTLTTDVDAAWGQSQPGGYSATLSTRIDEGAVRVVDPDGNRARFAYDSLRLAADADGEQLAGTLDIDSDTLGTARLAIELDPRPEDKPMSGEISLDGFDLGFLQAFLPQFDEVGGVINAGGELSGALLDPRFDGTITLADPVVRSETLPLSILGGEILTQIKGKRAFMDGTLNPEDGEIVIEGSANWQENDWRAEVSLIGEDLNLQQDPLISSEVHHDIRISARAGAIQINGTVDIPRAEIRVEEVPRGAPTLSDDVVVIEDIEPESEDEPGVDPPGDLDLAVSVNVKLGDEVKVGDDVNIEAYGLTASLLGDISISMRSPNPVQLGGEIEVVDGVYKQYGQDLEASGEVLFVGPVNQTRLAIDAIRRIENEDRIAGMRIGGTVETPEISLFTEPADKPEEAILSYIVLGRDIGEASDQQANLLATAALALATRGGKSLGGGLAESLGIEDFALETQGKGDDTELVVSGRVNERVLLSYGRSVFGSEVPTYKLRYEFTKDLYLEAAQGFASALDLFYSFSF